MAAECERRDGLHVMGDTTILEFVDAGGSPVPDGERGEIVVTHLWNYTMPLIRYRTGDQGVARRRACECGRGHPMLERVAGRNAEYFLRPDGGAAIPELFLGIIGRYEESGEIRKYQVIQDAIDRITVRAVLEPGATWPTDEIRDMIVSRIAEVMGAPCRVDFVIEDEIAPTPSGKHPFTISKVGRPPNSNVERPSNSEPEAKNE